MSMFDSMQISATGMSAERIRMDVIAENLANANSTSGPDGQPYRRKEVVLQAAGTSAFQQVLNGLGGSNVTAGLDGVQVARIQNDPSPLKQVYDPSNPAADKQGYVSMPNVDSVTEMVDLITASRGYEADTQAMNAAKTMFAKALEILR